ncbi:MAG: T9SS type A sorting domain-containing protein [Flavobacteriales bacterium]|nr:T9SS type A sorting domain-containing protein [Flavobacteriales bacterium]
MKKIYTLFLVMLVATTMVAQVAVTFEVDMTGQVLSANGVHIAGNFQDPNGDGIFENPSLTNWQPGVHQLTDPNFDLVYSITLQLIPERYEFKFINGNDWPGAEDVPPACQVEVAGNDNRVVWIAESTTHHVCFASCAPCGMRTVRFRVDMTMETVDAGGVHVAGDFQNPDGGPDGDWDPSTCELTDPAGNGATDNVYEGWYNVGTLSTFEYKFVNGNSWDTGTPESFTEGPCLADNDNRFENISQLNTVLPVYCFNSCDACSEPVNVTFSVDLNTSCMDYDTEGVNLMGTATDWNNGLPMDDSDNDNVYMLTLALQPGDYEYKFRVGTTGWEGLANRLLTVVPEMPQVLPEVCFGSTDPCGPSFPPADVTFEVKESTANPVGAGHSMWLMGDFTNWQGNAIEMTDDDGDNIWTHEIQDFCPQNASFKFAVGLDTLNTSFEWVEESADFSAIGGCGVDNGTFSDNRFFERTDAGPLSFCYIFDTCQPCVVSVEENVVVNGLNIFPVPAEDILNVTFESVTNQAVVLTMVNQLGQDVISQKSNAIQGLQTIAMNINHLSTGLYTLEISNGITTQTQLVAIR